VPRECITTNSDSGDVLIPSTPNCRLQVLIRFFQAVSKLCSVHQFGNLKMPHLARCMYRLPSRGFATVIFDPGCLPDNQTPGLVQHL
jgi:hypothetical protein